MRGTAKTHPPPAARDSFTQREIQDELALLEEELKMDFSENELKEIYDEQM